MGAAFLSRALAALLCLFAGRGYGGRVETRVAVVTAERDAQAQAVVDLAVAELSGLGGIVLLAREEIDLILREHELSIAYTADEDFALRAGALLAVEVFAIVEFDSGRKEALGLVVYDARTAVRLWDATLPPGTPSETARQVAQGVRRALAKRAAEDAGAQTICVLTIRNEDLPRDQNAVMDGLARLVERQLTGSTRLSILERRRLDRVNEEARLTGQRPLLQGAMTLAELAFRRSDTAGKVEAVVRLTDVDGRPIQEIALPGRDLNAALAREMAEGVCDALSGGCLEPLVSTEREAEHFLQESKFWYGYGRYAEALRAAEAAYALDPRRQAILSNLILCLVDSAVPFLGGRQLPGHTDEERQMAALHYVLRAVELKRFQLDETRHAASGRGHLLGRTDAGRYESSVGWFLRWTLPLNTSHPEIIRAVKRVQQEHRLNMLEINRRRCEAVTNAVSFNRYLLWFGNRATMEWETWALSARQWVEDMIALYTPMLELARRYEDIHGSRYFNANRLFLRPGTKTRQFDLRPRAGEQWAMTSEEYRRLDDLFAQMRDHPHPLISLYGRRGLFRSALREGHLAGEEIAESFAAIRQFYMEALDAARRENRKAALRAMLYQAALDAIDALPDPAMRRVEQQALFDSMLERREMFFHVEQTVTHAHRGVLAHYSGVYDNIAIPEAQPDAPFPRETILQNIHRAMEQLKDPETEILMGTREISMSVLQQKLGAMIGPAPGVEVPWSRVRALLDPSMFPGFRSFSRALFGRDGFYVAVLQQEISGTNKVSLVRISADDFSVRAISAVAFTGPLSGGIGGSKPLPEAALDERHFYLATLGGGLLIMPLNGEPVRRVTRADGLPADEIQTIAPVGDHVFMGVGEPGKEAYLVAFHLPSGEVEVLGSSLRRAAQSPLDNLSPPPHFAALTPLPDGSRVYFLLHSGVGIQGRHFMGLWSLDVETREVSRRLPLMMMFDHITPAPDGALWLWEHSTAIRFDPKTDTAQLVFALREDPIAPRMPPSSALIAGRRWIFAPYAQVGNWLWSAQPLSRLSMDGRRYEVFVSPDPRLNRARWYWLGFDYWPALHALSASMVDGLWLFQLQSEEAVNPWAGRPAGAAEETPGEDEGDD